MDIWFISLGQHEHAFLGSALHFIQIHMSLPTFAGCTSVFSSGADLGGRLGRSRP